MNFGETATPRAPLFAVLCGALLLLASLPPGGCGAAAEGCGDGIVDPGEACDDGNTSPHDGCNNLCTIPGTVAWTYAETSPVHGHISPSGIDVAADRSIYVIGTAALTTEGDHLAFKDHGALIRKLTPDGQPLWRATATPDEGGSLRDLLLDDDSAPIVIGTTQTYGASRMWVRRYASDGALVWSAHDQRSDTYGGALVRLQDDTLLAGGAGTGGEAPWLQRLDDDGALLERALLATASPYGRIREFIAVDDRVFAAGDTEGMALIAALDGELDTLWTLTDVPGSTRTLASFEGDLFVAGFSPTEDGLSLRSWIRRLRSADGSELWRLDFDSYIADIAVDSVGAIIVVGDHGSTLTTPTAWIAKLDRAGTIIWSVDESLPEFQTEGETRALTVALDDEDRIFVAGHARDAQGYARLWVQERAP